MGPVAVVISKALHDAKGRLASTISAEGRRRLATAMALHVMDAVASSSGLADRFFVSPEPELLSLSQGKGFTTIPEDEPRGMNRAFLRGIEASGEAGARGVLLLPSDLPLLQPRDVEGMARLVTIEGGVVILPSADGGTSGLGLQPASAIPLHFEEPLSYHLHRRAALEAGLPLTVLRWPDAGLDLDGPEDLRRLWASPRPSPIKDLLQSMGSDPEVPIP